ncbi:MAG TPA: BREX system ATP-binding domain-containing protein [Kofleriaceae bacterium]|nr:BREX system ATP-binding domain-containing protein [Kofleriaceae bacterium]
MAQKSKAKPKPPSPPPSALSSRLARRILGQMGENGKPPELGISHVNAGNDSYLQLIDKVYIGEVIGDTDGSSFKLVQGTYGAGKTHFLYCVRDLAWRRNLAVAFVTISPKECPLDKPRRVYQAVAQQIQLARAHHDDDVVRGIDDIARRIIEDRVAADGRDDARAWVERLARAPIERHSFRRALTQHMTAVIDGDHEAAERIAAWLRGEDLSLAEVKAHGIFEVPGDHNGFGMLRSLAQAICRLGQEGSVLLFDEAERRLSIDPKRRKATEEAMDHLRELIDLCGRSELPRTLILYAVTPAFAHEVLPEYPALQQRLGQPVQYLSAHNPRAPLIDLEALDLDPRRLLREVGVRLAHIATCAYDWSPDANMINANLKQLVATVTEEQLEVSHRRLFVKIWIRLLDDLRLGGDQTLSAEDVAGLVRNEQTVLLEEEHAGSFFGLPV